MQNQQTPQEPTTPLVQINNQNLHEYIDEDGNIVFPESASFECSLRCMGDLVCESYLKCMGDLVCESYLKCMGDLVCEGDLKCMGDLVCVGDLECKGNLFCKGDLECKGKLTCEGSLRCYGYLECYGTKKKKKNPCKPHTTKAGLIRSSTPGETL